MLRKPTFDHTGEAFRFDENERVLDVGITSPAQGVFDALAGRPHQENVDPYCSVTWVVEPDRVSLLRSHD